MALCSLYQNPAILPILGSMLSPRLLILFFRQDSLLRIFMWLMGFGILVLLDSLATVWLASRIGAYLAIALVGAMTWISLAVQFASLSRHIRLARKLAARGGGIEHEFRHICGLVVSALLIITPGLLTDILAWAIYVPPLRLVIGNTIVRRNRPEFEQLHQHLSVDEL
jgi:UPF0716 family protein affecting phage T7 exclusion